MSPGKTIIALALAGLSASCGGDGVTMPEGFGNRGGTGNLTLSVQALVDVGEVVGGFQTEFRVSVLDRAGDPVSGAEVTIEGEGAFPPIALAESAVAGAYSGGLRGAATGALRLSVQKDGMFVRDVVLGNIGVHAFVQPQPNDTFPAGVPLTVRWIPDHEAPFAKLSTRDFTWDNLADRGVFVVPDSMNPAHENQRIELVRYSEVQIAGGLRGSFFRIEVRKSVEPVVVLDGQP